MKGMKTPYGRRGQICAHFGWSWQYVNHGISYAEICRIMADLPSYDYDKTEKRSDGKEVVRLSDMNADEVEKILNEMMK